MGIVRPTKLDYSAWWCQSSHEWVTKTSSSLLLILMQQEGGGRCLQCGSRRDEWSLLIEFFFPLAFLSIFLNGHDIQAFFRGNGVTKPAKVEQNKTRNGYIEEVACVVPKLVIDDLDLFPKIGYPFIVARFFGVFGRVELHQKVVVVLVDRIR